MQRHGAVRAALVLLFGGLAIYLCYVLRAQLLIIFAAAMFAVIFSPIVHWVQKLRIRGWSPGKGAAILILLLAVCAALTAIALFAIPKISSDFSGLSSNAPQIADNIRSKVSSLPFGHTLAAHMNGDMLRRGLQAVAASTFVAFKSVSSGLVALVTMAILTAYFILESTSVLKWTVSLFPREQQPRFASTLHKGGDRVQRWLRGQAMLMLILGCSSAVVFGFLHVRFFYALAVFAGIANFVPILGPIATVILAGIVAAADSWTKLLGVIIFYAVYQQVENSYLTPKIMRSTVGLPASAVLVGLAIGSGLAGVIGALLAVPTTALVATFIDEYVVKGGDQRQEQTSSDVRPRRAA
jgi:predicted PurR-regulated permease PerM